MACSMAAGVVAGLAARAWKGNRAESVSNLDSPISSNQEPQKLAETVRGWRLFLGVGICFGSFQAPWQALPVLIDRKIALDPGLSLNEAELTLSQTSIFVGWLLGAICLHPLMQRLDMKQVVALMAVTMLVLSLAAITLPYISALSMTFLCAVRLLHGMCLNIQGVQYMYMQRCYPGYGSQLCSLVNAVYAIVAVIMAILCGSFTLNTDWRIEATTWFGLPILVGILVAFPDLPALLGSLPKTLAAPKHQDQDKDKAMSPSMRRDLMNLAICFMVTVFAYYGLSYSADSLCSNPFLSATLISGSDVVACVFASRAAAVGRNRAQCMSFAVGGLCMVACAFGTVDSVFVMTMAICARRALSVVFVTIYVAMADIFPEWCQKTALPTCEIMGRIGGCLSPGCGSLPVHLSLPLFGFSCFVAARATMKLPDRRTDTVLLGKDASYNKLAGA